MPKNITRVKWEASGLPFGVSFDERDGTFSGSPEDVGTHTIQVTVTTNYGTDTKDVLIKAVKTGEWNNLQASGDFYPYDCVDTGEGIIFFGRAYYQGGLYASYNPLTGKFSDVLQLIDGEKYEGTTDTAYMFKDCAIDPESKKWVAFFGSHYVRTPEGVKDLGDDINLLYITCCWSKELQKFCVISRNAAGEHTSYIFDIDGNLLNQSTSINDIANFEISENHYGDSICWSSSDNKFFAVSTKQGVAVIISSTDGLNWEVETLNGTALLGGIYYTIYRIEELSKFVLIRKATLNSSDFRMNIYTSENAKDWTLSKQTANPVYKAAWSDSKKVLSVAGYYGKSYTTKDFTDWEEINTSVTIIQPYGKLIWSETANAFIAVMGSNPNIYTLHV